MIDSPPPCNDDAEQAVLSACFLHPAALDGARDLLVPDDFYREANRRIFRAIGAIHTRGVTLDPLTVTNELERTGELDVIGGKAYIGELLDAVPTAANVEHHAAIVRETAQLRRVIAAATDAIAAAHARQPFAAIDADLDRALSLARARGAGDRVFDDKHAMAAGALAFLRGEQTTGLRYGFAPLDRVLLPIELGNLILIGGASGSGKSTVARNLVRQWALRYEQRVGLLSIEMNGQEQLEALAFIDAAVSAEQYYRGELRGTEAERMAETVMVWRDSEFLRLNEQGAVTPEQALRMFRRWRSDGVTLFVVDHLHRLDYGATRDGELRVPMANFARALKSFAKDYQCRVIALVQYSKIKPHEEPDDSKIREANNILEESDGVLHIYRPLVVCDRDAHGTLRPRINITAPGGHGRYFERDAREADTLGHDSEYVYVKLGKQRRRIRDGLVRIPFNAETWALYDTPRGR